MTTSAQAYEAAIQKDILISEFSNLRQEQFGRTVFQQGIAGLSFTITAIIAGVAINQYASDGSSGRESAGLLLMILPIVSIVTGVVYHEQHQSILMVGHYIRDRIAPLAKQLAGNEFFDWEVYIRSYPRTRAFRIAMAIGMPLLICGTGVVALAASFVPVFFDFGNVGVILLWLAELAGMLWVTFLWIFSRSS
jgi:hypothetical protein